MLLPPLWEWTSGDRSGVQRWSPRWRRTPPGWGMPSPRCSSRPRSAVSAGPKCPRPTSRRPRGSRYVHQTNRWERSGNVNEWSKEDLAKSRLHEPLPNAQIFEYQHKDQFKLRSANVVDIVSPGCMKYRLLFRHYQSQNNWNPFLLTVFPCMKVWLGSEIQLWVSIIQWLSIVWQQAECHPSLKNHDIWIHQWLKLQNMSL